jgi:hypothetical protein
MQRDGRDERSGEMGVEGHQASPSMGHYAALPFVVKGKGPGHCGFRIADCGFKKTKSKGTDVRCAIGYLSLNISVMMQYHTSQI